MFSSLSDKQKEIVFSKTGKFVVRACPGSGKTYSVAARIGHRIQNWDQRWKGLAALSFTNIAWQEVRNQLQRHFNTTSATQYPHFLGTLDGFINQYIFLPFGHLVMKCGKRPFLVGEPHNSWNHCPYERCYEQYFDIVSYGINDTLIYPEIQGIFFFAYSQIHKKDGSESQHAANLRTIKLQFWQQGYANQRDANYFSMKILEEYPAIAKSIVKRFPEFIIDEAQDTTEVQMRVIDILIDNGLKEVALIGDPDQAIFEWNNARPDLFTRKYESWDSIELDENRRSSQIICNFTAKLTTKSVASIAIDDEVKHCSLGVEIVPYDPNDTNSVSKIINTYKNKCNQEGIKTNPQNIAILFRSQNFINILTNTIISRNQNVSPWISGDAITKNLIKAKYLIDNDLFKEGYGLLEKTYIKIANNKKVCSDAEIKDRVDEIGFVQHRKEIHKVVSVLPSTENISLKTWIDKANYALKSNNVVLKINNDGLIPVRNLFHKEIPMISDEYRLGTVHSIKGETFDAVLLLLKQKGAGGKYYKTLLNNRTKTDKCEELRIVYVAITRPRKYLMIAVPEKDISFWKNLI